jgi:hypothetical protein
VFIIKFILGVVDPKRGFQVHIHTGVADRYCNIHMFDKDRA